MHPSVEGGGPDFRFKRYIAFDCPQYYPSGGLDDSVATFETLDELKEWLDSEKTLRGTLPCDSVFDCTERRVLRSEEW